MNIRDVGLADLLRFALERERKAKGIKGEVIAKKIGISQASFSRVMSGKAKLTVERADQIAEHLGLKIGVFIDVE